MILTSNIFQLLLVWTPGKSSPIHDHANSHCVMKVLTGQLKETLYSWPTREPTENGKTSPLTITRESLFKENEVTYISDQLGLHSVSNTQLDQVAVSLHRQYLPSRHVDSCNAHNCQSTHPPMRRPMAAISSTWRLVRRAMSCSVIIILD
jgi:cysteine dioxygenase